MQDLILAIDQGTTGTTCALFELDSLRILSSAKVEFPQIFPRPGWVEHSLVDIWETTLSTMQQALAKVGRPEDVSARIACIGMTNQRETVCAWDKVTSKPLHNAIVWQCRRTSEQCEKIKENTETAQWIADKTGLVVDPYFSATKMKWLVDNCLEVRTAASAKTLCLGTIDSFLLWKLTRGKTFATEASNASRTQLFGLSERQFLPELLSFFGIDREWLPEVRPSVGSFGFTEGVPHLRDGIPILGCLGDQQAALFGQQCWSAGEAKITFGTGAFLLMNVGTSPVRSAKGLLATVAYTDEQTCYYALEGAAFIAGAAVQFVRDQFGWIKDASEIEALALQDARDPSIVFVPALAGLGAPYWNPYARGALLGLSRGTTRSQIARAVLESLTLQNVQLLNLMSEESGLKIRKVGVDGKAALNQTLMQFQADFLQTELHRPESIEATSLGAAMVAKKGLQRNATSDRQQSGGQVFLPKISAQEARSIVQQWEKAATMVSAYSAPR